MSNIADHVGNSQVADLESPITALVIEDNPGDVRLLQEELSEITASPFRLLHRDRLSTALEALAQEPVDVALLDLSLPDSQGLDTFRQLIAHAGDVPVVVITGTHDESLGLEMVRGGAQDYLVKGSFSGMLLNKTLLYAIERKKAQVEREKLVRQLQDALARVHMLSGLLPICANCKKIRDDAGRWERLETYISTHSNATFTHGLCPECMATWLGSN